SIRCEIYAVERLILRFDYDGAVEILELLKYEEFPIYRLVLSCKRSLNFNFSGAKVLTDLVPDSYFQSCEALARYRDELPSLMEGNPHEMFNELTDNIIIQLEREAY